MRLPWWGVLCVIAAALPILLLFDHFGKLALARPTLYSAAVIGIAIAMRWNLRRHLWFWSTMAAIAALHIPLILYVPWTTKSVPIRHAGDRRCCRETEPQRLTHPQRTQGDGLAGSFPSSPLSPANHP